MKNVRLVQLDGKLPNLALMKLAHWHQGQGGRVTLVKNVQPSLLEPREYDVVYGSAIFRRSLPLVRELQAVHPGAIVGGTGAWEGPGVRNTPKGWSCSGSRTRRQAN